MCDCYLLVELCTLGCTAVDMVLKRLLLFVKHIGMQALKMNSIRTERYFVSDYMAVYYAMSH